MVMINSVPKPVKDVRLLLLRVRLLRCGLLCRLTDPLCRLLCGRILTAQRLLCDLR